MANLLDIRRRIKSVKNTQQITKAMKMVSAAKLKRAQERAVAARPFAVKMGEVLTGLASYAGEDFSHPLLDARGDERYLLVLVTAVAARDQIEITSARLEGRSEETPRGIRRYLINACQKCTLNWQCATRPARRIPR